MRHSCNIIVGIHNFLHGKACSLLVCMEVDRGSCCAGAQVGGGGGWRGVIVEGLLCPFLQIEKSALILEVKGPDCVHFWVDFQFKM